MIVAIILFFLLITICAPILGKYIATIYIYDGGNTNIAAPKNHRILFQNQTYKEYFYSLMVFNLICMFCTFIILYFQNYISYNQHVKNLNISSAINAAISFSTGTFWQSHNPETELTMISQIFALTAQNFFSGATGVSVFIAFTRGIINNQNPYIGNFYQDFLRALLLILLPFSMIIALFLVYFGVPQDFSGIINYKNLLGEENSLYLGPVAGQVAIKNFVTNGGSIFASASAHPFESPSREAIMLNMFMLALIPSAMIFAYGFLVKAIKLSWSLYAVVVLIMSLSLTVIYLGETKYGLPFILNHGALEDNFNYIGKEMIYDKFPSLMWISSITMSSCGSSNACLENYSPFSTLVLFFNLIVSKFIIEGIGSGFFSMLSYLIIAVFLRGLITAETPNFFGKRITITEINYVIIVFLIMPVGVLLFTSITLILPYSESLINYHGSQAITDITYNFASSFANNGSSFSGINISTDYFNYMTACAMFIGRYPVIYFSLAISGSFAKKQRISSNLYKNNSSNIELCFFLVITVFLVSAIMFLPLMILGPLVEFINI